MSEYIVALALAAAKRLFIEHANSSAANSTSAEGRRIGCVWGSGLADDPSGAPRERQDDEHCSKPSPLVRQIPAWHQARRQYYWIAWFTP
jgi:hypothetical protein